MKMKLVRIAWIVSALALMAAPEIVAQGKGKGKSKGHSSSMRVKLGPVGPSKASGKVKVHGLPSKGGASVGLVLTIGASERRVIKGYVANHSKPGVHGHGLPPGLAKKVAAGRGLPPGWQKKCVVGEVMPLAIFKACHPMPMELQVKLSPAPPGTSLVAVDGRVFRVSKKTHKIHGVFIVHP